jgi:hypothetical protein
MLETSYILDLGQLLKITPKLNRYLWQKLKVLKTQNLSRTTIKKEVGSFSSESRDKYCRKDNHMTIIQVRIRKNKIEDVLLDGGFGVNIIIE